jgi:hypothetical protein
VKLLLEHPAVDKEARNEYVRNKTKIGGPGYTALYFAARRANPAVMALLLEAGVNTEVTTEVRGVKCFALFNGSTARGAVGSAPPLSSISGAGTVPSRRALHSPHAAWLDAAA